RDGVEERRWERSVGRNLFRHILAARVGINSDLQRRACRGLHARRALVQSRNPRDPRLDFERSFRHTLTPYTLHVEGGRAALDQAAMWFKNLIVYRLAPEWSISSAELEERCAQRALQACGAFDMQSRGWVHVSAA